MIADEQAIDLGRLAVIVRSKPTIANRYYDAESNLAREVLAMLARREAEQAERAKPIDAEWLESIGFENQALYCAMHLNNVHVIWHFATARVRLGGVLVGHYTLRGQLLDLLAALKGGDA